MTDAQENKMKGDQLRILASVWNENITKREENQENMWDYKYMRAEDRVDD